MLGLLLLYLHPLTSTPFKSSRSSPTTRSFFLCSRNLGEFVPLSSPSRQRSLGSSFPSSLPPILHFPSNRGWSSRSPFDFHSIRHAFLDVDRPFPHFRHSRSYASPCAAEQHPFSTRPSTSTCCAGTACSFLPKETFSQTTLDSRLFLITLALRSSSCQEAE